LDRCHDADLVTILVGKPIELALERPIVVDAAWDLARCGTDLLGSDASSDADYSKRIGAVDWIVATTRT